MNKDGGFPLPDVINPEETFCVTIEVPADRWHIAAFWGALQELTYWFNWQRDDDKKGTQAAQVWRDKIATAYEKYKEGGCVDCLDIANCIQDDADVQYQIKNIFDALKPTQEVDGSIPEREFYAELVPQDETNCDYDALFGMIRFAVDRMHKSNLDFLEIVDVNDNVATNVSNMIEGIPLVGELPVDDIIEFMVMVRNFIATNYSAQYTEAYYDEICCDLFCIANGSGQCHMDLISVQNYFLDRMSIEGFDLSAVTSLLTMMTRMSQLFTGGVIPGTVVCDAFFFMQLGFVGYINDFLGVSFGNLVNWFRVGIGFPDDDWTILCDTCLPEDWTTDYFFNCDPSLNGQGTRGTTTTAGNIRWMVNEVDSEHPGGCVKKGDGNVFTIYPGIARSPAFAFNWEFWYKTPDGMCHSGFPIIPSGGLQLLSMGGKPTVPNPNGSYFEFKVIP